MAIWLALIAGVCSTSHADEMATYLERHGLTDLLAMHLEQQLEHADPAEAAVIMDRLASLYSQLLETTTESDARDRLRERALKLLASAPGDLPADELRIALLRGSYRQVERIAENHRLRQASASDLDRARGLLAEIIFELNQARLRIRDLLEVKNRRLNRAAGADAVQLAAEADELRSRLAQCMFLLAWSHYYNAFVHGIEGRKDDAINGQTLFAELLDLDQGQPRPEDVSVDLRGVESVARSILGLALCKSILYSAPIAEEWLRLLEHPRTIESLREEVPAWKLAIHLEDGDFASAVTIWGGMRNRPAPMPLAWARLAAVHALEAAAKDPKAALLAQEAMAELALRGELDQIVELARRYGTDALGDSGFAPRYVRGVIRFDEARAAHGSEQPTTDASVQQAYDIAAQELESATSQPDAARFEAAKGGARMLLGWCRYLQSQWSVAGDWFEQAVNTLPADQAAQALWMAVLSADRQEQERPDSTARARLDSLIDKYLSRFPTSDQAPTLVLKRAMRDSAPTVERVEQLLAIGPDSSAVDGAQRRAADMLDQLRQAATGDARARLASRLVEVNMVVLRRDVSRLEAGEAGIAAQFLNRARRTLEVALADVPTQEKAAGAVLDLLDRVSARIDWSAYEPELTFRRVQAQVAAADLAGAGAHADRLWSAHPESPWTKASQRLVFKALVQSVSGAGSSDRATLELGLKYGGRVLADIGSDSPTASDDLPWVQAHAELLQRKWERFGDSSAGAEALALLERLLAIRDRDPTLLRSAGLLHETLGNPQRALECWRLLVAGTPDQSEDWYEAKFHLLTVLARLDPARARTVMNQHKSLHPNYGPEPWRSRLEALDGRLGAETRPSSEPVP